MADGNDEGSCNNCPELEFEQKELEDKNALLHKQLIEKDAVIFTMTKENKKLHENLRTQNLEGLKVENKLLNEKLSERIAELEMEKAELKANKKNKEQEEEKEKKM